ncbi:hypothetical protein Q3G72_012810 [Acer saccharum]|nr:hypothetical protein Q3G72_012810 [Acer saccharum]
MSTPSSNLQSHCFLITFSSKMKSWQISFDVSWEEADELCRTVEENEDKSRTASKMADVMYHAMVLLTIKNVKTEEVLEVLRQK